MVEKKKGAKKERKNIKKYKRRKEKTGWSPSLPSSFLAPSIPFSSSYRGPPIATPNKDEATSTTIASGTKKLKKKNKGDLFSSKLVVRSLYTVGKTEKRKEIE